MTRSRLPGWLAVATATVLIATACGGDDSNGDPVDGATVAIATSEDFGNLDPQSTNLKQPIAVARYAYDPPVTLDNDQKLQPGIVTEWSGDGTTYSLTVRDGVTCSDGDDMTAQVVADNINYVADPENGSPLLGLAVPRGVEATADEAAGTVDVTLAERSSFFVENLSLLPLVCPAGMADRESLATSSSGTGPYVVEKVVPGDRVEYSLRDGYTWGPPGHESTDVTGIPSKLVVQVVKNESTRANLLTSGQLHVAPVSGTDAARLEQNDLFSRSVQVPGSDLTFNHGEESAASDVAVRQALIKMLDIDDLAQIDSAGLGTPPTGIAADPKVCPGDTTDALPTHDEDGARELLESAGWAGSGDVRSRDGAELTMDLIYLATPDRVRSSAEYIAEQWSAAGVKVTLRQMDKSALVGLLFGGGGGWDAAILDSNFANPEILKPFVSGPFTPDGLNWSGMRNDDYETIAALAAGKVGADSCAEWMDAERALLAQADYIPFSALPETYWGDGATFELGGGVNQSPVPTSIRALG